MSSQTRGRAGICRRWRINTTAVRVVGDKSNSAKPPPRVLRRQGSLRRTRGWLLPGTKTISQLREDLSSVS